jgi:hypothetical protein
MIRRHVLEEAVAQAQSSLFSIGAMGPKLTKAARKAKVKAKENIEIKAKVMMKVVHLIAMIISIIPKRGMAMFAM